MNLLELPEEAVNAIQRQLFKYYDIDIEISDVLSEKELCYYEYPELVIHGSQITDDCREFPTTLRILCKLFPHTIEDLYLHDGKEFINPTTTIEQQEAR